MSISTQLNSPKNDSIQSLFSRIMDLDRQDIAVPARQLRAELQEVSKPVETESGEILDRLSTEIVLQSGEDYRHVATDHAVGQLSDRLSKGLRSFGNEMISRGNRDLYVDTINEVLSRADEDTRFQVRTMQPDGQRLARAVVSDSFKPIDDNLIVPSLLEVVADNSATWRSLGGQLTDTKTRIKFISREPVLRSFGPNGRDIFAGFLYSNSEVGQGMTCFEAFFFDSFCENGCVFGSQVLAKVNFAHRGTRIETNYGLISEERVQAAQLTEIQALIVEATRNVVQGDHRAIADAIERADSRKLEGDKPKLIELLGSQAGLTKSQNKNLMLSMESNEMTAFGVSNAITKLAQDQPHYEARMKLENAGGKVLEMTDRQWKAALALAS